MHTDPHQGWQPVSDHTQSPTSAPTRAASSANPPDSANHAPKRHQADTPSRESDSRDRAPRPAAEDGADKRGGFSGWLRKILHGGDEGAKAEPAETARKPSPVAAVKPEMTSEQRQYVRSVIDRTVRQHRITVSSQKGGVTKTTTVLGLGTAFGLYRRDLSTAIDANPHRGTLSDRLGEEHRRTVRDLLENIENIRTVADYRDFTSLATSRLEVIASEKDQEKQALFSPDDYRTVLEVVQAFRQIVITDTGTDMMLPLMQAVFENTDTLIVPTTTSDDSIRLAKETLQWWRTHAPNGDELVRNAVIPLTRMETFTVEDYTLTQEQLFEEMRKFEERHARYEAHIIEDLGQHVRVVVPIPNDRSLRGGSLFQWDALNEATQEAYIRLAFEVASGMEPRIKS